MLFVLGLAVAYFKWQSDNGDARIGVPAYPTTPAEWDAFEIELFREYLRIPSVHPHADYSEYLGQNSCLNIPRFKLKQLT